MIIKTSNNGSVEPFIKDLYLPPARSHKGQNGRILVIGGSSLFHSASIWAAEAASYFVDIVHYSSTAENNQIFLSIKKKFTNGIVVKKDNLSHYVLEDDVILVGPGMVRKSQKSKIPTLPKLRGASKSQKFVELVELVDEGEYTRALIKYLIENFPEKKFVFDAGALQMMDKDWLKNLKTKPILTPHQIEFKDLFGVDLSGKTTAEKADAVKAVAKKYQCLIILKAVDDIISDGKSLYIVEGGNSGLTKGGTGDILAGLTAAFYAKNQPLTALVLASFIIKKTADKLFLRKKYWYNVKNVIDMVPETLSRLIN